MTAVRKPLWIAMTALVFFQSCDCRGATACSRYFIDRPARNGIEDDHPLTAPGATARVGSIGTEFRLFEASSQKMSRASLGLAFRW
jgi:hypothetical protein